MTRRPGRRPPRGGPPPPSHADWEVLQALLTPGQYLEFYEAGRSLARVVIPAGVRPEATPVGRTPALALLSRGWIARVAPATPVGETPAGGIRVTRYRLSLRGWYAIRRVRPDLLRDRAPPTGTGAPRRRVRPPAGDGSTVPGNNCGVELECPGTDPGVLPLNEGGVP